VYRLLSRFNENGILWYGMVWLEFGLIWFEPSENNRKDLIENTFLFLYTSKGFAKKQSKASNWGSPAREADALRAS
jgi:hypothetical protein